MQGEAKPARPEVAPPPPAEVRPAAGRGKKRIRIAAAALALLLAGLAWWLHARHFEDTDDAQIDGDITSVSARVPGTVVAVLADDNEVAEAGRVLVQLDPTDLEVAVAQAKAAVAQAQAQVASEVPGVSITETSNRAALQSADADVANAQAEVEAAQRDLEQAQANERLARLQLERARQLVAGASMAPAEYDQRVAAAEVATAAVAAARQRLAGRRTRLDAALTRQRETRQNAPRQLVTREASVEVRRANLELAQAQLRQAQLNLSYANVAAPAKGVLGRKSVHVGEHVQPGQQLFALTQTDQLWVTANFRETQIEDMRPGQPVTVRVDAISRDFRGKVESFAGATGSRYSLLPPENASGNYVKVVQRIPVRIRLDPGQPELARLRPGMSVEPKVRVR